MLVWGVEGTPAEKHLGNVAEELHSVRSHARFNGLREI